MALKQTLGSRSQVARGAAQQQGRFMPFRAAHGACHAAPLSGSSAAFAGVSVQRVAAAPRPSSGVSRAVVQQVLAVKDGAVLDRKLRVAIIGGGPSGACAAETLAKGGCEAFLIERKMDNCKVCVRWGSRGIVGEAHAAAPLSRRCHIACPGHCNGALLA